MNIALQSKNGEQIHLLQLDDGEKGIQVVAATIDQKLATYDELSVTIALQEGEALDVGAGDTAVLIDGGEPREYIINEVIETDDEEHTLSFYADLSAVELTDEIVREEVAGKTNSHAQAVAHIMQHTRWQVFDHAENIHARTIDIEMRGKTVIEALTELAAFYGFEYDYVYAMDDTNNITHRVVNLRNQVGADTEKRFEIDKDMESVSRTVNAEEIKTAIIAVGNELEDGTRIDLVGLEWKRTDGKEVDKTKTADFLEIPEATKAYGRYDHTTKRMRPRFLYAEFSAETQESLAIQALDELKRHALPTVTYEAQVVDLYREDMQAYRHEKVGLGDRVAIIDHDFMQTLAVSTRVVEFRRDLLDELNNEIVLGDARDYFPDDAKKSINEINRKLAEEKKEREKLEKKQADFEWEAMEGQRWAAGQIADITNELTRDERPDVLPEREDDPGAGENYLLTPFTTDKNRTKAIYTSVIRESGYYFEKTGGSVEDAHYFAVDEDILSKTGDIFFGGKIKNVRTGDGKSVDFKYMTVGKKSLMYSNGSEWFNYENNVNDDGSFMYSMPQSIAQSTGELLFRFGIGLTDEGRALYGHRVGLCYELHDLKLERGEQPSAGYKTNPKSMLNNYSATTRGVRENIQPEFIKGGRAWAGTLNLPIERLSESRFVAGPASAYNLVANREVKNISFDFPKNTEFVIGNIYTVSFEYDIKGAGDHIRHHITAFGAKKVYNPHILKTMRRENRRGKVSVTFKAMEEDDGVVVSFDFNEELKATLINDMSITIDNFMIQEGLYNGREFVRHRNDQRAYHSDSDNLLTYKKAVQLSPNNLKGKGIITLWSQYMSLFTVEWIKELEFKMPAVSVTGGQPYALMLDFIRHALTTPSGNEGVYLEVAVQYESEGGVVGVESIRYSGEVERNDESWATIPMVNTQVEHVITPPKKATSMTIRLKSSFHNGSTSGFSQLEKIPEFTITGVQLNRGTKAAAFRWSQGDVMDGNNMVDAINNSDSLLDVTKINFDEFQLDANMIDFEGFQFDASKLVNLSIDDSHITGMDGAKITDASITDEKITDVDASKIKNMTESKITDLSYKATKKYITESGEDMTNAEGLVMVPLSSSLIGKADLAGGYQVFLQAYDRAQLFVPYRDELYFTVESDVTGKQTRFGWKVEALQKQK